MPTKIVLLPLTHPTTTRNKTTDAGEKIVGPGDYFLILLIFESSYFSVDTFFISFSLLSTSTE